MNGKPRNYKSHVSKQRKSNVTINSIKIATFLITMSITVLFSKSMILQFFSVDQTISNYRVSEQEINLENDRTEIEQNLIIPDKLNSDVIINLLLSNSDNIENDKVNVSIKQGDVIVNQSINSKDIDKNVFTSFIFNGDNLKSGNAVIVITSTNKKGAVGILTTKDARFGNMSINGIENSNNLFMRLDCKVKSSENISWLYLYFVLIILGLILLIIGLYKYKNEKNKI